MIDQLEYYQLSLNNARYPPFESELVYSNSKLKLKIKMYLFNSFHVQYNF